MPSVLAKTAGAIEKTDDGFTYLNPADFPNCLRPTCRTTKPNSRRAPRSWRRRGFRDAVDLCCVEDETLLGNRRRQIRSSIPILSVGTMHGRTARRRKSRARATPF